MLLIRFSLVAIAFPMNGVVLPRIGAICTLTERSSLLYFPRDSDERNACEIEEITLTLNFDQISSEMSAAGCAMTRDALLTRHLRRSSQISEISLFCELRRELTFTPSIVGMMSPLLAQRFRPRMRQDIKKRN